MFSLFFGKDFFSRIDFKARPQSTLVGDGARRDEVGIQLEVENLEGVQQDIAISVRERKAEELWLVLGNLDSTDTLPPTLVSGTLAVTMRVSLHDLES